MRANRWRVYLNPFDYFGNYTSYQDVTDDVSLDDIGSIAQNLDNTDYDIGIYRFSNFDLTLRNESGKYLDAGQSSSIFKYKRGNSLCRLSWEIDQDGGPYAGTSDAGSSYLSVETDVFIGLLNDDSSTMDIDTQKIKFTVVGRESILDQVIVPFASLSAGQLISSVIYTMLNQPAITSILTISAGNISVGIDAALDSVADLQNKTVKDALNDLLLISNSVLYVSNGAIVIAPRTASAAVKYNFYGQASNFGAENVQNIQGVISGLSRTFNYLSWTPSNVAVSDSGSIAKFGVRTKQLNQTYVTSGSSQTAILNAILSEFSQPKQEFDLMTPLNYATLALGMLDRVSVDYPPVLYSSSGPLPVCGACVCGQAVLPSFLWSFSIDTSTNFKITGKQLDLKESMVQFRLRAI